MHLRIVMICWLRRKCLWRSGWKIWMGQWIVFLKRIETLVEEKKAFETQVDIGWSPLEADEMRKKEVGNDVAQLL